MGRGGERKVKEKRSFSYKNLSPSPSKERGIKGGEVNKQALAEGLELMTTTDWIQAISMVILVIVTGIYVWRTHVISKAAKEQADTSAKMAEEMKAQRYDTIRPVIDIEILNIQKQIGNQPSEAVAAINGDTSYLLSFVLHNIGLGPAIGVCSATPTSTGARWRWDFDTLAAGRNTKVMYLSLKPEDGLLTLSVFYTDAYNRTFDSGRQVSIDKEKTDWEIGPLLVKE